MKSIRTVAFLLGGIILTIGLFSSCKKDKETIATIIVKNSEGTAVPGASVRLFGNGTPDDEGNIGEVRFDTTATTNGTGKVSFNFSEYYKKGQAGFVVLDIQAEKGILYGQGIIKVEEEVTSEESVIIE